MTCLKTFNDYYILDDKLLVKSIIQGNTKLAASFLKQQCRKIFEYINTTRLRNLDLEVDDLINDFYLFLEENDWEKLRAFRFESKLSTWVNLVASRYLLKKYQNELKEKSLKSTPIESVRSFVDEENSLVRAELIEAISKLNDKRHQQVLLLTLQGFDAEEIGKQIGITTNNVYVIKTRAIAKLKEVLYE